MLDKQATKITGSINKTFEHEFLYLMTDFSGRIFLVQGKNVFLACFSERSSSSYSSSAPRKREYTVFQKHTLDIRSRKPAVE